MGNITIKAAHIAVYQKGDGVYPHTHEFYQMYHVISGTGFAQSGDAVTEIKPNAVVIFFPGEVHSIFEVGDNAIRLINVQFYLNDSDLDERLRNFGKTNSVPEDFVHSLWKVKDQWSEGDPLSQRMANCLLEQYLIDYFRYCDHSCVNHEMINPYEIAPSDMDGVSRLVADYVSARLDQKISLDELAEELAYSKNYLCRVFKQNTGLTIFSYANLLRVGKAIELIRFSDKKLSEIALTVGFSDFHYFSKVFRQVTGFTPSNMRDKEIFSIYLENRGVQSVQYRYFGDHRNDPKAKKGPAHTTAPAKKES